MDFAQFAHNHGLIINSLIQGKIIRCATASKPRSRNGAYFFADDYGFVQDWQYHESPIIWKSGKVQDTPEFRQKVKESQKKYYQDRAKMNADAANKAKWILGQCHLSTCAYLNNKGFPDVPGNIWDKDDDSSVLVIPMRKDNNIVGCQLIDESGNKKFLKGQSTKGAYFQMGGGSESFLVEGYASGLSLQKILTMVRVSHTIIVAFSANNIKQLSSSIRGFIVADNDESGTGERIAAESGLCWWMPPIVGMDINDYHMANGTFKVSQELKKVLYKIK